MKKLTSRATKAMMMMGMRMCSMCSFCITIFSNVLSIIKIKTCFQ